MRSFKKAIAIVLTLAMLVAMFAFSASAEATYSMVLQGSETAAVGDTYTVKVRLNDTGDQVGGVAGTITATGATLKEAVVNPELLTFNKTAAAGYTDEEAAATIINEVTASELKFASVANLDDVNHSTRVWFMLTYEITAENPTFTVNAEYSNREGTALLPAVAASTLTPVAPVSTLSLVPDASIAITTDVKKQALRVSAEFSEGIPAGAVEYGMLFCPTQLLGGEALTFENDNVNIRVASADATANVENYNAYIKFNFSDANEDYAYTLTGVKFSARAYYKTAEGDYVYSENNTVDVVGGVFDKAIISVAKDLIGNTDNAEVLAAFEDMSTKANKDIIFNYLYNNPPVKAQ